MRRCGRPCCCLTNDVVSLTGSKRHCFGTCQAGLWVQPLQALADKQQPSSSLGSIYIRWCSVDMVSILIQQHTAVTWTMHCPHMHYTLADTSRAAQSNTQRLAYTIQYLPPQPHMLSGALCNLTPVSPTHRMSHPRRQTLNILQAAHTVQETIQAQCMQWSVFTV